MSDAEVTRAEVESMLAAMMKIRRFEQWIIPIYPTDVLVTPVHLHIGQEAVPVGVCAHLTDEDTLSFGHRTHGPALAKGMPLARLMAELFGRTNGCSGGFGGSMHVIDFERGMFGSSAIVGGCIALGVGSALAAKLGGGERIAVSYFGDAATNGGAFWESMNFAALQSLPVLFVCENNNLSNTMQQHEHLSCEITAAAAPFMQTFTADGTDVLAVWRQAGRAVSYVRGQRKPALIECKTKRWMKHQGVDHDDLACNPIDESADCPIRKLQAWMIERDMITPGQIDAIERDIQTQIETARRYAEAGEYPDEAELLQEV